MPNTVYFWNEYQPVSTEEMVEVVRTMKSEGLDFPQLLTDQDVYGETPSIHPPQDGDIEAVVWEERELQSLWDSV